MTASGLAALCAVVLFAVPATADVPPILPAESDHFDLGQIPVYNSRVRRVPDARQARALKILGKRNFCKATPEIVVELLQKQTINCQQMLDAQARAADQYAKEREDEAKDPFFQSSKKWMLADTKAHRNYAKYTRKLSPALHPYLVKGKVYNELTGGFTVTLQRHTLIVEHGSLGHPPATETSLAVIVFLEREINDVRVSADLAE